MAAKKGKYIGFKNLTKKIEGEGKSKKSAEAITAAEMRKKYKRKISLLIRNRVSP